MDLSEGPPLMPKELADLMGCSRAVIDAALKTGAIPHTRLGRRYFIPRSAARALLQAEPLKRAGGLK